jgi:hypothetical protein
MSANGAGALYIPTDVTPEELFQAIGRLRKEARDEIDRLIRFLDKTDDYVSRDLEDSIDDNPQGDGGDQEFPWFPRSYDRPDSIGRGEGATLRTSMTARSRTKTGSRR